MPQDEEFDKFPTKKGLTKRQKCGMMLVDTNEI